MIKYYKIILKILKTVKTIIKKEKSATMSDFKFVSSGIRNINYHIIKQQNLVHFIA